MGAKAAAAARYEYDSASYARNFDDGAWMAEEGVLARAVVRRGQTRRCAVIHDRASLPIPSFFVRTRD